MSSLALKQYSSSQNLRRLLLHELKRVNFAKLKVRTELKSLTDRCDRIVDIDLDSGKLEFRHIRDFGEAYCEESTFTGAFAFKDSIVHFLSYEALTGELGSFIFGKIEQEARRVEQELEERARDILQHPENLLTVEWNQVPASKSSFGDLLDYVWTTMGGTHLELVRSEPDSSSGRNVRYKIVLSTDTGPYPVAVQLWSCADGQNRSIQRAFELILRRARFSS